ncbi:MAG TPA: aminomethyltransferase family protein [Thermoplasmata archaeon]|nr:aminomethyltransferase family protein [Thermoplasmata archaeon]
MSDLRLRGYHEVSGALFRREAGWEVPAGYGALDREVDAVRRAAGILDMSDRTKVRVRGSDRLTFLDGLVTADLKVLPPGMSAYALVLDEASRVLGDLRIRAVDDTFLLDIDAAQSEALLDYFRKQIVSDDVTLEDLGFTGHIEVHGPLAARIAEAVLGVDVHTLSVDEHGTFPLDRHHHGYVARVNTLGEIGYAIWAQGDSLALVWDAFIRSGALPVGRDALEVLRIEAGRPRFGVDMTPETLALEVAPEGVLSFTKGCYRGQEVVARGVSIGQVTRHIVGLRIEGDVPPNHGDPVRADNVDAGHVTSGAWSPTRGWVIALALLRTAAVKSGGSLVVDRDGWTMAARLASLPFVIGSS